MNMVFPMFGLILYYIIIFTGAHFRYDIADWGDAHLGGDFLLIAITYLTSILIVGLWCNMRPFNMWGMSHADKYGELKES